VYIDDPKEAPPGVVVYKVDSDSKYADISKAKVYINYPSEAPPGRHVGRGARGGYYYITNVREAGKPTGSGKQEGAAVGSKRRKKGWGGGGGAQTQQKVSVPPPPDIAKNQIKVTGKGVGLVATLENGHIKAKKIDNEATNAFIKQVVACGKSPEAQYGCIGKIADKMGLQVKEA
jgi:hypothetical protein